MGNALKSIGIPITLLAHMSVYHLVEFEQRRVGHIVIGLRLRALLPITHRKARGRTIA